MQNDNNTKHLVLGALRSMWLLIKPALVFTFEVIAALILLFEEWGWRPLAAGLARLARYRFWARIELWIAGLPPYAAVAVFAAPSLLLFPVKISALWLLAEGHILTAGALLAAAKVVSTALVARIFMLTKPALMQLEWFAWAYNKFIPWKEALFDTIRQSTVWKAGHAVAQTVRARLIIVGRRMQPFIRTLRERGREIFIRVISSVREAVTSQRRER